MNRFKKGSQWRKWDLHVHTPESILNNQYGNDWDLYVKELFKKAIEYDVHSIGITDYFLPLGYKKIRTEYLNNNQKLSQLFNEDELIFIRDMLIIPNIEFRLKKFIQGGEPSLEYDHKLNYHVIFSDKLSVSTIESDFISQLKFTDDSQSGGPLDEKPLTFDNLSSFGKKLKETHHLFAQHSDLYVGMMNASICEEQIAEVLNKNNTFIDKFLLGLPPDEHLSKVHWNSSGHSTRKNLIKQAQVMFSTNPKTVSFFLGGDDKDGYLNEFGSFKPCISGSDAHSFEKLFCPDLDRHTWIKADLSFEGLKQIVCDPKLRVRIQEICPQQKSDYQLIKKVRFIDRSNSSTLFSTEWIYFNPDLNTIIGGKSSGKSLLLYHIAKAINAGEVREKARLSNSYSYDELVKDSDFDFEVQWANGDISRLSDESEHPITYIPQLYINRLAEKQGQPDLNELVKQVLCQNKEFESFINSKNSEITNLSHEINNKISTLYSYVESYNNIKKEISNIGIKKSIEIEINKLKESIGNLRKKSGFTIEQENLYKKITLRARDLRKRKSVIEETRDCVKKINNFIINSSDEIIFSFKEQLQSSLNISSSVFLDKILDSLTENINESLNYFLHDINNRVKFSPDLLSFIESEVLKNDIKLKPLLDKVNNQKELNSLVEKLKQEEHKVKIIIEKENKCNEINELGTMTRNAINQLYGKLIDCYRSVSREVDNPNNQLKDNIKISAVVRLNEDIFRQFIDSFDGRGNFSYLLNEIYNNEGKLIFEIDNHAKTIKNISNKLKEKNKNPTIKKGISSEELTKRLYANCFYIDYLIYYKNDEIVRMSPGKRGLVLLNLLLHLSNASHPILIDQPEDNLDNRTIYDELNVFIREVKFKRQIIMVTHNANLVVSADAECVIVANQSGQQINLDNKKYRFEYCTGSLESSFNDPSQVGLLNKKGIREHVCEILEGGVAAFKERELKYGFKN